MSNESTVPPHQMNLELTVEELLRRARLLPPREDMVLDNLDEVEGDAFLSALKG